MTRNCRVRIAFAAVSTVLAFAAASPAAAYWEYGHQTIAQIADANVRPKTRAAIRELLKHAALPDPPRCKADPIPDASVWADCIKPIKGPDGKPRFGYAYTWHFQDVEICQPFDLTAACKDG